jgi:3-phosphoshikimate 1-carboxyvinyltransferase
MSQAIHAKVIIPGSKSITNRALLLAALSDGVCEIFNMLVSDDTRVFLEALHELGIVVMPDLADKSCIIGGANGKFPKQNARVHCGDAGTAARFLLAVCAATAGSWDFDASEQLKNRPIETLLRVLTLQGAKVEPKHANKIPFTLLGTDGLAGGEIQIDSSQTGQFASALLMAAPFAKTPMLLTTENLVSEPYVDMTCAMMGEFGVLVKRMHYARFYVPIPQRYKAREYIVEPDLSTASYFFAAAAVTAGEITIQAIDRENSKQADVKFLTVLEKMGCSVNSTESGLTVKGPQELSGVNVDMRDFSDTFMTLAAIAPFATSPTTITNIAHTRLKESDRITAMHEGLEKLQVKVESGYDWIRIHPSNPQAGVVESFKDHRIAMAFSIIGLRVPGIKIAGAECVSKTCPEFFTLWESMYDML